MNKIYYTLVVRKNDGSTEPTAHGHFWSLARASEAQQLLLKRRDDISVRIVEIGTATQRAAEAAHPVGPAYRPPFHGFPIVAQIPGSTGHGYGIVVKRQYAQGVDYIAFWTDRLDRPEWGQGHYFTNLNRAIYEAMDLAGQVRN